MSVETGSAIDKAARVIPPWVLKGIEAEAEVVFEEAKRQFIERLDRKKGEVIAGIVLDVQKRMRIEEFGQEIHIVISQKDKE